VYRALLLFFFFTLVTGPRRSLSLKLSDTRVCEPQIVCTVPLLLGELAVLVGVEPVVDVAADLPGVGLRL